MVHFSRPEVQRLPEIDQREGGHEEAVNGEACQGGCIQEFQEPEDGGVGHHEGGEEAYRQDAEVREGQVSDDLQEVVEAGQEHEGHCHDEGEVGAGLSGDAQKKAAGDGAAAPGEAGPEGQALEETDDEGLSCIDLVHVGNGKGFSFSRLFGNDHENAAQHEADDDGGGAEELMLDEAVEQEAHEAGREHGYAQVEYGGSLFAEPVMGIQDIGKFIMVHYQHRQDGAQLDKYVEQVRQGSLEAQHVAYDDHMARRGYRDVFRKPFYDTDN